jgi:uncharacterized protein YggE
MTQPIRTIGAGVLGALIVAVASLSAHAGPAAGAPSPSADTPASNTITVSASGKVSHIPDIARVSLGVSQTKPTVKAAREAAATRMNSIIAAMKALGVADADIQTVGLNLYPQYANGSTKIVGYTVGNQIQITVRDLDKADDVVDMATNKGATEVDGISFDIADPAKALNDARVSAIVAAQASAAAMASAAHLSLGSVISITDTTPPSPVYYPGARPGAFAAADAATPIQPGSQDVSANVTVVFAIN